MSKKTWRVPPRIAGAAVVACVIGLGGGNANAQRDVVIGAHEPGSTFYAYGAAIADVITKGTERTGKVSALAGAGVWLPMMDRGELDIGLMSHYDAWLAANGKKPYPKAFPLRLIAAGAGFTVGLYVRNDSDIRSRKDLRGKRIASVYAGAPTIAVYAAAEIANAGLSWSDVKALPRTGLYAGQREDVTEKRLDAFYASVGSGITRELDTTIGIRFLGLDMSDAALASMRKVYPVLTREVKAGPPGIRSDMTLVFLQTYLLAHESVKPDMVYDVAKVLWERNASLIKLNKKMRGWTTDKFVSSQAIVPYHPGAVRWYKEKDLWSESVDMQQKKLMAGN